MCVGKYSHERVKSCLYFFVYGGIDVLILGPITLLRTSLHQILFHPWKLKYTVDDKSEVREKFHRFSTKHKSFPHEFEQWLSLPLSIQMKQDPRKCFLHLNKIQ